MPTTSPEQSQVHSESGESREFPELDRILGLPVHTDFRGKIETAELWNPSREFEAGARIARLISTLLAYPMAYKVLGLIAGSRVRAVSSRDFLLGGVAVGLWMLLGEISVSVCGEKSSRLSQWVWQALPFAGLVLAASLAGMSSIQVAGCIGMSVVYVPLLYVIAATARHIVGSAQLVPPNGRIVIVGSRDRAKETISELREMGCKCEMAGCVDPHFQFKTDEGDLPVLGGTEDLPAMLFGEAIDMVLFALPLEKVPNVDTVINAIHEVGVPIGIVLAFGTGEHRNLAGEAGSQSVPLRFPVIVALSAIRRSRTYLVFKRILDICVSAALLVGLGPLLILLAVLVKVTSPRGPVLYPWKVLGRNRRPFVGYKFRTMVPNADQLKAQLMHRNEMTGPVFKIRNDPRVTPVGRVLRKFSFDELPQLYSVLKGDMSLVGPRPPSKQEADQFEFWQRRKLSVTPGITCLWQINGRNQISSFDEWARLDLEYIANASFRMDLRILLRTIPAVIAAKGAH